MAPVLLRDLIAGIGIDFTCVIQVLFIFCKILLWKCITLQIFYTNDCLNFIEGKVGKPGFNHRRFALIKRGRFVKYLEADQQVAAFVGAGLAPAL